MSERVPIYKVPGTAFVITTADGVFFRCAIETVGRPTPELRWTFTGADGVRHVGPRVATIGYVEDLQHFVDVWWKAKCAMGFAGRDASRMRARPMNEAN